MLKPRTLCATDSFFFSPVHLATAASLGMAALLLWAPSLSAQTLTPGLDPAHAQPIEVQGQPGEFIGSRQIVRERIKSGTNEFMFVVPEGVRAQFTPLDTVTLTSTDATYFITFRLLPPLPEDADPQQTRMGWMTSRYPNARAIEDFGIPVPAGGAQGIQLRYTPRSVGERIIQVVWVSCRAGQAEFTLNADAAVANQCARVFQTLLTGFRTNERGKIEIVRFSDKS